MAFRQVLVLLRRDLLLESRRSQTLLGMIIFAVGAMVVVRFGWQAVPAAGGGGVPAATLWVIFLFAVLLGLGRTYAHEQQAGGLDGLLLCPVDRVLIYAAKLLTNLTLLVVVQLVTLPVFALFFLGDDGGRLLTCLPVVLAADVGLTAVGTLAATLVLRSRSRDLVLPVVLMPLLLPLVIAASSATAVLVDGGGRLGDVLGRLVFLATYDVVFLVVAWGTYDLLVRE